jgi:glutaryl-CoA dehydrogenase
MYPIYSYAYKGIKCKYLPEAAAGRMVGWFADLVWQSRPTDPKTGSPTPTIAGVFVIWAWNEHGKIRGSVAEKVLPGLDALRIGGMFSLRASATGRH